MIQAARSPQQTDCRRYRHRRSYGEGPLQQGDAQDEGAFASSARPNGRQAQIGARRDATLLNRRISPSWARCRPRLYSFLAGGMLEQNLQKACTGLSKVVFAAACKLTYSAANHNDIPQDQRAIDRGIANRQIASQKDFGGARGEVSPRTRRCAVEPLFSDLGVRQQPGTAADNWLFCVS
jgi:hypothetical protein